MLTLDTIFSVVNTHERSYSHPRVQYDGISKLKGHKIGSLEKKH